MESIRAEVLFDILDEVDNLIWLQGSNGVIIFSNRRAREKVINNYKPFDLVTEKIDGIEKVNGYWLQITKIPINVLGEVGILMIAKDVTEEKELEAELHKRIDLWEVERKEEQKNNEVQRQAILKALDNFKMEI